MEGYEKETLLSFFFVSNFPMIKKINASVREHLTLKVMKSFPINCPLIFYSHTMYKSYTWLLKAQWNAGENSA